MVEGLGLLEELAFERHLPRVVDRHPDPEMRERLRSVLPNLVESAREKRQGAEAWARTTTPAMDEDFLRSSERLLLKTYLHLAESDIRITSHVARHAPTQEVRGHFDRAIEVERAATAALREASERTYWPPREDAPPLGRVRGTCVTPDRADVRSELEGAIRALRGRGIGPRLVIASPMALRQLEDQGLLAGEETSLMGVPVLVDFAWDRTEFAIQTYDCVPLEETRRR